MRLYQQLLDEGFGLLMAVDKPPHATSRDVVNHIQAIMTVHRQRALQQAGRRKQEADAMPDRVFCARPAEERAGDRKRKSKAQLKAQMKIGHGGTLDPMASGTLVIALGTATKQLQHFLTGNHCRKTYVVTGKLGSATDTYDCEGQVLEEMDCSHVTGAELERVLNKEFTGEIQQRPPIFSALRVNGQRMHDLARTAQSTGIAPPQPEPRTVHIHSAQFLAFRPDVQEFDMRVECGGGTYIRSIVHDLAKRVGGCAHITALRRVQQGPFSTELGAKGSIDAGNQDPQASLSSQTDSSLIPTLALEDLVEEEALDKYVAQDQWKSILDAYLDKSRQHLDVKKQAEQSQKRKQEEPSSKETIPVADTKKPKTDDVVLSVVENEITEDTARAAEPEPEPEIKGN